MVLYIAYLPDKLLMNTPVKLYNVLHKKEIIVSFQNFLSKFTAPKPFRMLGTPTGHLFYYENQLKWTHSLDQYKDLKGKNFGCKLLSKL